MAKNSATGEGARQRVPHARELGWDDSLYEEEASSGSGKGNRRGRSGGNGRTAGEPPSASPPRPPRRRRWRILRWAAAVLSLLILGTAGAGYLYYRHLDGNIRSGTRSNGATNSVKKPQANAAGQTPLNILLIGSDSRSKPENVKLGGGRDLTDNPPLADVQMLVHVSADRKNASIVSIPRDTRVDIPECKDPETGRVFPKTNAIINTTLARGGPGCTLATWQDLTHVYIDHWMTIDFSGVVRMADAIGGVDVCVRQNVWDRSLNGSPGGSGLKLKAGTTKIEGAQALQWLRTRHAFGSDLGRAEAQHMYLNSMIRELKSQNVFTDTLRLTSLAEAATKSLQVSEEIGSVKKLFDLGMQLKSVPTNRITSTTMPTLADPENPNHLVENTTDAGKLWALLRDDVAFDSNGDPAEAKKAPAQPLSKDPAAAPGDIGVRVLNGTGGSQSPVTGRAGEVARLLNGKGFDLARADAEQAPQDQTSVSFPTADLEGDAQAVAKSLGVPLTSVHKSTEVSAVTVIVGADWRSGSVYKKAGAPKAGDIPKSSNAINGSDKKACMDVYAPYRW